MATTIIITFCVLLISYVFDLTASKTKIHSVILLLVLGCAVKQSTILLFIPPPDVSPILPVLETVGLILIVTECSLEVELNKSKLMLIRLQPLLFIAPIALITILLFVSMEPTQAISLVNKSFIIHVIVLTALIMMFGLMTNKTQNKQLNK